MFKCTHDLSGRVDSSRSEACCSLLFVDQDAHGILPATNDHSVSSHFRAFPFLGTKSAKSAKSRNHPYERDFSGAKFHDRPQARQPSRKCCCCRESFGGHRKSLATVTEALSTRQQALLILLKLCLICLFFSFHDTENPVKSNQIKYILVYCLVYMQSSMYADGGGSPSSLYACAVAVAIAATSHDAFTFALTDGPVNISIASGPAWCRVMAGPMRG